MDDQMTEWKSKLERMNVKFIELNQKFDTLSFTKKRINNGSVTSLLI